MNQLASISDGGATGDGVEPATDDRPAFVLTASFAIIWIVKQIAGKYSRYIIGCRATKKGPEGPFETLI